MSRVLLVTTNYWPEPTGIAVYTTDLAESLATQGDQVTVLTSLPHYPWWRVPSEFAHLGEGTGTHNGLSIIRAKHLVPPKMNALLRMRFETSLWWNLRRVSKSMVGNDFDMVIACIPTVAAGIVGKRIAKKLGIPFGLIVQDLSGAGAKRRLRAEHERRAWLHGAGGDDLWQVASAWRLLGLFAVRLS